MHIIVFFTFILFSTVANASSPIFFDVDDGYGKLGAVQTFSMPSQHSVSKVFPYVPPTKSWSIRHNQNGFGTSVIGRLSLTEPDEVTKVSHIYLAFNHLPYFKSEWDCLKEISRALKMCGASMTKGAFNREATAFQAEDMCVQSIEELEDIYKFLDWKIVPRGVFLRGGADVRFVSYALPLQPAGFIKSNL